MRLRSLMLLPALSLSSCVLPALDKRLTRDAGSTLFLKRPVTLSEGYEAPFPRGVTHRLRNEVDSTPHDTSVTLKTGTRIEIDSIRYYVVDGRGEWPGAVGHVWDPRLQKRVKFVYTMGNDPDLVPWRSAVLPSPYLE